MTSAVLCASHTPLMGDESAGRGAAEAVAAAFARLADSVRAFGPDLVVQFSPDHFNGFFYDLMPPFCVGVQVPLVWLRLAMETPSSTGQVHSTLVPPGSVLHTALSHSA